jgi:hypothetical protein
MMEPTGPQEKASNLTVFEALWSALDVGYGLFGAKGVDWNVLRQQYLPRACSAEGEAELFDLLAGMLSHLHDKHIWLIGSDRAWNCRMKSPCPLGDVDDVVKAWKAPFSRALIEEKYLHGRALRFTPEMSGGQLSPHMGYLQITAFPDEAEQVGSAVDQALVALDWPRAMVVDVRDNRGGSDRGVKAVADRFADCRRLYQTASVRAGPRWDQFTAPVEWWLEPGGPRQFRGRVALLVNRDTFSAGETFALAMRVLPHVTIVGEPTAGVFSDAVDAVLPNGWQFTYSIGMWRDAQGILWEDRGVPPDIVVTASAAGLVSGCDEALDWAIERLASV